MFSKKVTKIDEIFTVDLTLCSKCQIDGEDFVIFCVLLRKHELYIYKIRIKQIILNLCQKFNNTWQNFHRKNINFGPKMTLSENCLWILILNHTENFYYIYLYSIIFDFGKINFGKSVLGKIRKLSRLELS